MQNNKKKQPSSILKTYYLSCRSHLPCLNKSSTSTKLVISPIPISKKSSLPASHYQHKETTANAVTSLKENYWDESVEMQWQRVHELEKELVELEEWLGNELSRLKRHLKNNNNKANVQPLCFTKDVGDQRDIKFGRLVSNGGYLYSLNTKKKVLSGSCQDLVIQFSSPSLVPSEIGSNVSEVLNHMAAMGKETLITWLTKSMPMTDVSKSKKHGITITPCNAANGLLEAILLKALPKLGCLVIKGLRIQMGVKEVVKQKQDIARQRTNNYDEEICDDHANDDVLIIMAMLIQPRNPQRDYEAMNEMMIGLVEVTNNAEEDDEENEFRIKGVHVAGLVARNRNGQVIHNCLWYLSASLD